MLCELLAQMGGLLAQMRAMLTQMRGDIVTFERYILKIFVFVRNTNLNSKS
jgi:hypothetical protein